MLHGEITLPMLKEDLRFLIKHHQMLEGHLEELVSILTRSSLHWQQEESEEVLLQELQALRSKRRKVMQ